MSQHGFFQITQKVFLRKGNLLLIMRDKKTGHGDLPGGRMTEKEFFEDWTLSVHRELEEEMGSAISYKLNPEPIFFHKHRVNEGNHPCIIIAYSAEHVAGDVLISDEHDFLDWVDVKSFQPEGFFSEYMLEAVRIYIKKYA